MRIAPVTDAELAAEAAAGNAEAFGQLIERHTPQIRRITRAVLSEPADADDAAQEAFLACWRYLGRYDPARPFGPWLIRIAVNAARDVRRRQRSRPTEPLAPDLALQQAGPDRRAARAELRESLNLALAELPERQRLAVVLFDAEGYSHREIAGMLGVAEGTVRSDVFHARCALRVALAPYQEESR